MFIVMVVDFVLFLNSFNFCFFVCLLFCFFFIKAAGWKIAKRVFAFIILLYIYSGRWMPCSIGFSRVYKNVFDFSKIAEGSELNRNFTRKKVCPIYALCQIFIKSIKQTSSDTATSCVF